MGREGKEDLGKQDSRALRTGGSRRKIQKERSEMHMGNKGILARKSRAEESVIMLRPYVGS